MVSAPAYDQTNSVNFAHSDGMPYDKLTVAYYAGTWVNNCNAIGSGAGTVGAGLALFKQFGLKGLSIWAVRGARSHERASRPIAVDCPARESHPTDATR
eukprot:3685030-Prymnesium_polylepis.1